VHLFGFIIRLYHDARSSACQKRQEPTLIRQTGPAFLICV